MEKYHPNWPWPHEQYGWILSNSSPTYFIGDYRICVPKDLPIASKNRPIWGSKWTSGAESYSHDQKNAGSVCQAQRGFTSNNYHKRNKGPVVQDHVLLLPIELPSTVFTQQCESELKFLNYTKVFILPSNNYVLI
uniref:Uncharacterized protein n=1 Tax=Manihot esculenta TaxID=3983 RepID=A0A2C9UAB4_MANES